MLQKIKLSSISVSLILCFTLIKVNCQEARVSILATAETYTEGFEEVPFLGHDTFQKILPIGDGYIIGTLGGYHSSLYHFKNNPIQNKFTDLDANEGDKNLGGLPSGLNFGIYLGFEAAKKSNFVILQNYDGDKVGSFGLDSNGDLDTDSAVLFSTLFTITGHLVYPNDPTRFIGFTNLGMYTGTFGESAVEKIQEAVNDEVKEWETIYTGFIDLRPENTYIGFHLNSNMRATIWDYTLMDGGAGTQLTDNLPLADGKSWFSIYFLQAQITHEKGLSGVKYGNGGELDHKVWTEVNLSDLSVGRHFGYERTFRKLTLAIPNTDAFVTYVYQPVRWFIIDLANQDAEPYTEISDRLHSIAGDAINSISQ